MGEQRHLNRASPKQTKLKQLQADVHISTPQSRLDTVSPYYACRWWPGLRRTSVGASTKRKHSSYPDGSFFFSVDLSLNLSSVS